MVGLHTFYSEGMNEKRDMGYEKTHHAQSMSEKKCLRHEKKRRISHVRKKEEKERNVIMQKGVPINLMLISSTHSGPSIHLTIFITSIHVNILI
jgi:hypothetical protein